MATVIDEVIQRNQCSRRVRLFGFLWRVRCGGTLITKPCILRPGQTYTLCTKCRDASVSPEEFDSRVEKALQ